MKKILSAIVVAALGWVAFDRATLALELRCKADEAAKAVEAADTQKRLVDRYARVVAQGDVDAARTARDAATAAYAAARTDYSRDVALRDLNAAEAALDRANAAADSDAVYAAARAAATVATAAYEAADSRARDATTLAVIAGVAFVAAIAVAIHLNRKTSSA